MPTSQQVNDKRESQRTLQHGLQKAHSNWEHLKECWAADESMQDSLPNMGLPTLAGARSMVSAWSKEKKCFKGPGSLTCTHTGNYL